VTQALSNDQVRAVLLLLNGGKPDLRRRPKPRPPAPLKLERTCTDCGQTLPLQEFVKILWNQKSIELSTSESTDNFRGLARLGAP
jgi:hypothetical protein